MTETIDYLSKRQDGTVKQLGIIDAFIVKLNDPDTDAEVLIQSTGEYFSHGTIVGDFKVFRSTYDDLTASGNMEILGSAALNDALTSLNTNYTDSNEALLVNTDWILGFESTLVGEFDWFRFNKTTAHMFPSKSPTEIAADIRLNEDNLRRHAALLYWFTNGLNRGYGTMINQSQDVRRLIEQELDRR